MANFIIDNWFLLVVVVVLAVVVGTIVFNFFKLPSSTQLDKVREWCLYAVVAAEKELGAGTGAVKLRLVYDRFLVAFPAIAKIMSFETFSAMVDEALDRMKDMLDKNEKLAEYVEK